MKTPEGVAFGFTANVVSKDYSLGSLSLQEMQ